MYNVKQTKPDKIIIGQPSLAYFLFEDLKIVIARLNETRAAAVRSLAHACSCWASESD